MQPCGAQVQRIDSCKVSTFETLLGFEEIPNIVYQNMKKVVTP